MMVQPFAYLQSKQDTVVSCDGPNLLILDTRECIQALNEVLRKLPLVNWETHEVLQFILSAITYEDRARLDLEYSCMDLVNIVSETDMQADIQTSLRTVTNLGYELVEQLKRLRAYQHGYLFYGFHSLLGHDLVLVKMFLNKNPEMRISHD